MDGGEGATCPAFGTPQEYRCLVPGAVNSSDSEEQTEVAAVFNATIPLDSEQEREQALLDVICRMKEDSIAHRTENLAPTDMQGLMNLMQAKKELEELKAGKLHLHISFC